MDCQFVIALKFHMLQFKGGVFKVATHDKWMVVVSDPVLIDELRKAPQDELAFDDAVIDVCFLVFDQFVIHLEAIPSLLASSNAIHVRT
jgi:hypothetical protein